MVMVVNLALDALPAYESSTNGSDATNLAVSGVVTFTANYTISNDASYTGRIVNTVNVQANGQGGSGIVTDQGDDPSTAEQDDSTIIEIDPVPGLVVEKTATVTDEGDGSVGAGDVINYIITVRNSGNVTLTGLTVSDTITDANSSTLT